MSDKEIIKQFADALAKDMQVQLDRYTATGETRDSIEVVIDKGGLGFKILGAKHIGALIDGRKPTSEGAKESDPTLQEQIFKWIKAKSIQPKERSMSVSSLAFLISRSIHENGYKGKGDIFKTVLNDQRFNSVSESLLDSKTTVASSNILKEFKL